MTEYEVRGRGLLNNVRYLMRSRRLRNRRPLPQAGLLAAPVGEGRNQTFSTFNTAAVSARVLRQASAS
jgi:hypothetical protein